LCVYLVDHFIEIVKVQYFLHKCTNAFLILMPHTFEEKPITTTYEHYVEREINKLTHTRTDTMY